MAFTNVSRHEINCKTVRDNRLSVLRYVTLFLEDGTSLQTFYAEWDNGIAHTFQNSRAETFKSDKITYSRGYGLYVCDTNDEELLSTDNRERVAQDILDVFLSEESDDSVVKIVVTDEIIPCSAMGKLLHSEMYYDQSVFSASRSGCITYAG